jgi:hypothetical protein
MDTMIGISDGARDAHGVEHATSLDVEKSLNAETPRRGDTQS